MMDALEVETQKRKLEEAASKENFDSNKLEGKS